MGRTFPLLYQSALVSVSGDGRLTHTVHEEARYAQDTEIGFPQRPNILSYAERPRLMSGIRRDDQISEYQHPEDQKCADPHCPAESDAG